MKKLSNIILSIGIAALVVSSGCRNQSRTETGSPSQTSAPESSSSVPSYEEFKSSITYEEESGFYILDGDETLQSEKQLIEFYERYVAESTGDELKGSQAMVHTNFARKLIWPSDKQMNITYCVSDEFDALGFSTEAVVTALERASQEWEESADIDFIFKGSGSFCTGTNPRFEFSVLPTTGKEYLARAFSPSYPRENRILLIDEDAFKVKLPTLTGLMRHELGHTLGLAHEHYRVNKPLDSVCKKTYRLYGLTLTPYDKYSAMHYPVCDGAADTWEYEYEISDYDRQGVALLYNRPLGNSSSVRFGAEATASAREWNHYKVKVKQNETISASIMGTGDADLYVRLGAEPTESDYDCRPFTNRSEEECEINTGNNDYVYIGVRGYRDSEYKLAVIYPRNREVYLQEVTVSGSLKYNEWHHFWAFSSPSHPLTANTTVHSGDPDLYLRDGQLPGLRKFDCKSSNGSGVDESCHIDLNSEGQNINTPSYVSHYGYQTNGQSDFSSTISWRPFY